MCGRKNVIGVSVGVLMLMASSLAHAARIILDPASAAPFISGTVQLKLMLDSGDAAAAGLQIDVAYDPALLMLGAPTLDPALLQHTISTNNSAATGVMRVVLTPKYTANPAVGNTTTAITVANIPVSFNNNVQPINSTPLVLSKVVAGSATGASIVTTTINGVVNWNNQDTDHDGMPDWWELKYSLNPNDPSDAGFDADGDGLTNLQEYQNRTGPKTADSDNDGMPDGWEVKYGLNPLDPSDASKSLAGDSMTNLQKYQMGYGPRVNIAVLITPIINLLLGLGHESA